jgi:hypothetical protein
MRRQLVTAVIVFAALAAPGSAAAASPWASVNVCDSAASPNGVGVRAGLPGNGSGAQMYARFTAQWRNPRSGAWQPVEGIPTSPWLSAGSARQLAAQVGWTFQFEQPPPGTTFQVRGLAELQWRSGRAVTRSQRLVTRGGVAGVNAGEPLGTSLARCTLH